MRRSGSAGMRLGIIGLAGFESRKEEYEDLLQLLLTHRSRDYAESEKVAREVAFACLGENHLWQDMSFRDRQELSGLLEAYFKPLFDKNSQNMKWKKFFYKQLCELEGISVCKSPSCGVCIDYLQCFGPEDG
ncbi:nitrogen fixation protein NifQ [Candidatus Aquicultor sp.]